MTKLLVFTVFAAMTTACAPRISTYVDPQLMTQFNAFQHAATERGVDVSSPVVVIFGTPQDKCQSNSIGCCTSGTPSHVEIDKTAWLKLNAENQELLMFHELGHCLLGRVHRMDTSRGIPESIMFPETTESYLSGSYPEFREDYLNELFGESKSINFGWN